MATINVSVSGGQVASNTAGITSATAVANIISLSQAAYDALGTSVSSTTIYVIT